jgi:hypothetical protein
MNRLERRLRKIEEARGSRVPYVVRDFGDPEALARTIAKYRTTGQRCAVLPEKCSSVEEWTRRYGPKPLGAS